MGTGGSFAGAGGTRKAPPGRTAELEDEGPAGLQRWTGGHAGLIAKRKGDAGVLRGRLSKHTPRISADSAAHCAHLCTTATADSTGSVQGSITYDMTFTGRRLQSLLRQPPRGFRATHSPGRDHGGRGSTSVTAPEAAGTSVKGTPCCQGSRSWRLGQPGPGRSVPGPLPGGDRTPPACLRLPQRPLFCLSPAFRFPYVKASGASHRSRLGIGVVFILGFLPTPHGSGLCPPGSTWCLTT